MGYSSGFSQTTSSSTSNGVAVETSMGDETWSSSLTADSMIQTSSPDDSDGLAGTLAGSAVAVGDDTLALGSIEGPRLVFSEVNALLQRLGKAPLFQVQLVGLA